MEQLLFGQRSSQLLKHNMTRETKKFKTTNGHEVEIYTYLTGREQREIDAMLINEMMSDINIETGKPQINANFGEAQKRQEDKLIETIVVSIDDGKEKILDTVLDMKAQDYNEIMKEINSQTAGSKKK